MKILFIHQNFPGQYKNLAPALAARGDTCVALTLRVKEPTTWKGVRVLPYQIKRAPKRDVHPWLIDFNTKTLFNDDHSQMDQCQTPALSSCNKSQVIKRVHQAHKHAQANNLF